MSKPLRLLTIGHSYAVDVNRSLAHGMQRAGAGRWEVTVAAPTYFAARNDIRPIELHVDSDEPCPVRALPTVLTRRVHAFAYCQLPALLREPWDFVHAWEEPYILAGWQIGRHVRRGTPFVFRSAQSLPKRYPLPFAKFESATVRRAAGWSCSGKLVEANLLARPHYADRPHAVIPLGVDTEQFRPDPAACKAMRLRLGWADDGVPVIGFFGRFVAQKGLPMLMRVLDRLATPWRALFVGGGPLRGEMARWSEKYPDRVRLLTDVAHHDVPAHMNACDAIVLPSQTTPKWAEQFGRTLIEAMAVGVPVLASDSGEIPNVLGRTGVVLPEADEAAWVAALTNLLNDPARRRALAEEGRSRAVAEYDWLVIGRQRLDFFTSILDSRR